jgi:hypothetical protein
MLAPVRNVRGVLFVDYVRMLRSCKSVDVRTMLQPEDVPFLTARIDPDAWYPMTTFERMGNAILHFVARGEMMPVRMWGRFSATQLKNAHPTLLVAGEPLETLERFRLLRATFFDFDALSLATVGSEGANLVIRYHMGMPAEEAASHQTLGFFEGLLQLAGAQNVEGLFKEKSWAPGNTRTLATIRWKRPKSA